MKKINNFLESEKYFFFAFGISLGGIFFSPHPFVFIISLACLILAGLNYAIVLHQERGRKKENKNV